VNQTNPNLIAFAGQFNAESNYYNQDLNYVWVTDRSTMPPTVAPLDRTAPSGPAFQQKFQARAGWWSPDGRWFAFESNRICNEIDGQTYAIFIQDVSGTRTAVQVPIAAGIFSIQMVSTQEGGQDLADCRSSGTGSTI